MITGCSVEQRLEQAVGHGALGMLNKPIDVQKMLGMLERIKPDGILVREEKHNAE
jgi:DNA-binding NtrC family response regulator